MDQQQSPRRCKSLLDMSVLETASRGKTEQVVEDHGLDILYTEKTGEALAV